MSHRNTVSALLLVLLAVLIVSCVAPIPDPWPPELEVVEVITCTLDYQVPRLHVELRPTPKEYVITANWGDSQQVHCIDGRTIDATEGRFHAWCDNSGALFFGALDEVTLTVTWDGREFSQTVEPDYEICFPNGPRCGGQPCDAQVILELPLTPDDLLKFTPAAVEDEGGAWASPTSIIFSPHSILSDLRVRQAIAHCIGRNALIASVYPYVDNPDTLLMDSFLPKAHWAYGGPYDDMPKYDPETGMALLEESGWTLPAGATVRQNADGEPLILEFTTTTAQYRQTWGAVFVQNMTACGIEIVPNYVPAAWWFGDTTGLARRDFELGAFAWVGETDPGGRTLYACNQIPMPNNNWEGQNYMGWCNETANDAIVLATNTLLREDRMAAYDIVQEEFARDVVSIPLFQRAEAEAWSANLEGVRPDPTEYATTNLHEWTLADGGDTIVIGMTQEPDSMLALVSSMAAQRLVAQQSRAAWPLTKRSRRPLATWCTTRPARRSSWLPA